MELTKLKRKSLLSAASSVDSATAGVLLVVDAAHACAVEDAALERARTYLVAGVLSADEFRAAVDAARGRLHGGTTLHAEDVPRVGERARERALRVRFGADW